MNYIYICPFCGNVNKYPENCKHQICLCGNLMQIEHSYPNLQAVDSIRTVQYMFDACKNIDKNNRLAIQNFLKQPKVGVNILDEDLIKYISLYEAVRSKYRDNFVDDFINIDDEFEKKMLDKYNVDFSVIDSFIASSRLFLRNYFRKSFIIMLATSIELLFNDYFGSLVLSKLGNNGGEVFLSSYEYASIKDCIEVCSAFTDKPIDYIMNSLSLGFFDRWSTLRNERNSIIHSNNRYISSKRINDAYKLIEESILVFSNLKSLIYKQNKTNKTIL